MVGAAAGAAPSGVPSGSGIPEGGMVAGTAG
jgi:hypothetical protein